MATSSRYHSWVSADPLRVAAYVAYLAALLVIAAAWVFAMSARRKQLVAMTVSPPAMVGTVLQVLGAAAISLWMPDGPLRPSQSELVAALVLAPVASGLFVWTLLSAGDEALVTRGAFAWVRHPMYLALLGVLIATGMVVSVGARLLVAIAIYLAGSEMRIAAEETELHERFGWAYEQYRRATRWRYLPGLR